jgi:hypothetical protein
MSIERCEPTPPSARRAMSIDPLRADASLRQEGHVYRPFESWIRNVLSYQPAQAGVSV